MESAFMIAGGLGVFLYGLRIMSAGLQKLAGNRLRAILAGLTRNRLSGILSGFVITCAAQSSSATTVLVVSFANAGLLTLMQAIGLVMGANIGTTLTAWLVSLFGFKVKISAFALPIIGIGFPLSLLKERRSKQFSEVLIGFGLLFLGLAFLKEGVPDLRDSPEALEFLRGISDLGFFSLCLFVVVGTILTITVQSSSAATAITLTLVAKQWIGLELAAAMVLGENIGTTITAQLASIGANRNARRVAVFHTLFNLIGVLWMLPILSFVVGAIAVILPGSGALAATSQVAMFHTSFNIANTALLFWFVPQLERVVLRLVPTGDAEHEGAHLKFLHAGLMETAELAVFESRRAAQEMVGICEEMHKSLTEVLTNPKQKLGPLLEEIRRQEQKTDEMEEEIVEFCSEVVRLGASAEASRGLTRTLEMVNDIERIGDHCMNLVLLAERRWDKGYQWADEAQKELNEMVELVGRFLTTTRACLGKDDRELFADARIIEERINKKRDNIRKDHAERIQRGDTSVRAGLIYLDMMTNLEKIGDYCWNVCALAGERGAE